jgi:hypothetical protein
MQYMKGVPDLHSPTSWRLEGGFVKLVSIAPSSSGMECDALYRAK